MNGVMFVDFVNLNPEPLLLPVSPTPEVKSEHKLSWIPGTVALTHVQIDSNDV